MKSSVRANIPSSLSILHTERSKSYNNNNSNNNNNNNNSTTPEEGTRHSPNLNPGPEQTDATMESEESPSFSSKGDKKSGIVGEFSLSERNMKSEGSENSTAMTNNNSNKNNKNNNNSDISIAPETQNVSQSDISLSSFSKSKRPDPSTSKQNSNDMSPDFEGHRKEQTRCVSSMKKGSTKQEHFESTSMSPRGTQPSSVDSGDTSPPAFHLPLVHNLSTNISNGVNGIENDGTREFKCEQGDTKYTSQRLVSQTTLNNNDNNNNNNNNKESPISPDRSHTIAKSISQNTRTSDTNKNTNDNKGNNTNADNDTTNNTEIMTTAVSKVVTNNNATVANTCNNSSSNGTTSTTNTTATTATSTNTTTTPHEDLKRSDNIQCSHQQSRRPEQLLHSTPILGLESSKQDRASKSLTIDLTNDATENGIAINTNASNQRNNRAVFIAHSPANGVSPIQTSSKVKKYQPPKQCDDSGVKYHNENHTNQTKKEGFHVPYHSLSVKRCKDFHMNSPVTGDNLPLPSSSFTVLQYKSSTSDQSISNHPNTPIHHNKLHQSSHDNIHMDRTKKEFQIPSDLQEKKNSSQSENGRQVPSMLSISSLSSTPPSPPPAASAPLSSPSLPKVTKALPSSRTERDEIMRTASHTGIPFDSQIEYNLQDSSTSTNMRGFASENHQISPSHLGKRKRHDANQSTQIPPLQPSHSSYHHHHFQNEQYPQKHHTYEEHYDHYPYSDHHHHHHSTPPPPPPNYDHPYQHEEMHVQKPPVKHVAYYHQYRNRDIPDLPSSHDELSPPHQYHMDFRARSSQSPNKPISSSSRHDSHSSLVQSPSTPLLSHHQYNQHQHPSMSQQQQKQYHPPHYQQHSEYIYNSSNLPPPPPPPLSSLSSSSSSPVPLVPSVPPVSLTQSHLQVTNHSSVAKSRQPNYIPIDSLSQDHYHQQHSYHRHHQQPSYSGTEIRHNYQTLPHPRGPRQGSEQGSVTEKGQFPVSGPTGAEIPSYGQNQLSYHQYHRHTPPLLTNYQHKPLHHHHHHRHHQHQHQHPYSTSEQSHSDVYYPNNQYTGSNIQHGIKMYTNSATGSVTSNSILVGQSPYPNPLTFSGPAKRRKSSLLNHAQDEKKEKRRILMENKRRVPMAIVEGFSEMPKEKVPGGKDNRKSIQPHIIHIDINEFRGILKTDYSSILAINPAFLNRFTVQAVLFGYNRLSVEKEEVELSIMENVRLNEAKWVKISPNGDSFMVTFDSLIVTFSSHNYGQKLFIRFFLLDNAEINTQIILGQVDTAEFETITKRGIEKQIKTMKKQNIITNVLSNASDDPSLLDIHSTPSLNPSFGINDTRYARHPETVPSPPHPSSSSQSSSSSSSYPSEFHSQSTIPQKHEQRQEQQQQHAQQNIQIYQYYPTHQK